MVPSAFNSPPNIVWALNLNDEDQASQIAQAAEELSLCIGNPSIVRFDPTVGNLRTKLSPLNRRICVLFLRAKTDHSTGGVRIQLANNELLTLEDTYDLLQLNQDASYFVVLVFDDLQASEPVDARGQRDAVFCVDLRSLSAVVRIFGALVTGWSARSLWAEKRDEWHYYTLMRRGLEKVGTSLATPVRSSALTRTPQNLNLEENAVNTHAVLSRFDGTWSAAYVVDEVTRLLQTQNEFLRVHSTKEQRLSWAASLLWLLEVGDTYIENWFEVSDIYFTHINPGTGLDPGLNDFEMHPASVSRTQAVEFMSAFVVVPEGCFDFGVVNGEADSEPPAPFHQRELSTFSILDRPVTVGDLRVFLSKASALEQLLDMDSSLPATMMSAAEALSFAAIVEECARSHGLIMRNVRMTLPDEYQWEAAAGGLEHTAYPWGSEFSAAYCNSNLSDGETLLPVYSFSPQGDSEFGCTDMAGNVREWTRSVAVDRSGESFASEHPPTRDLVDLSSRDRLVVRGGSYTYNDKCVQTWVRNNQGAYHRDTTTGFRLVIESR